VNKGERERASSRAPRREAIAAGGEPVSPVKLCAVRILVVLTQPPLPEGGAPGRCALGLLRGLVGHGFDVHALAARQSFSVPGEPPEDLPVDVVTIPPEEAGRGRLERLRRPGGELARGIFLERVREAARESDVVHLEETETAWCDLGVERPSLVHLHYLVRRDRTLGLPVTRDARHALELALAERAAIRRHRFLVASSPLVADGLRKASPRAEVVVAPLSLDPELYEAAPLDGPAVAGIIGTATWPPTAAAMLRLGTEVWPEIRRRVPEASLAVAGRGTASLPGLEDGTGIELAGEVGSAREFLRGLSVLVFPLERGSGMKVKVLEAMASGLPVVTTPAGAEGVLRNDGVVVETDPRRLAAAAASILRDAGERKERGAAALRAFEERHTPEPATRPLAELYRRIAS